MTRNFWADLAERVVWTFVQAFIGAVTAVPLAEVFTRVDVSQAETLVLSGVTAGVAAVFSVLKGVAAGRLAKLSGGTAQLMPGAGTYSNVDDLSDSPDERFEFEQ